MGTQDFFRASWATPEVDIRNSLDSVPPAYTEGSSFRGSTSDDLLGGSHAACCAFTKLDANTGSASNQTQIQKSPRLRFISWVLLCRSSDESIPITERFSCPLAKCDAVFDGSDCMQLVHHVSGCPHLSRGMYRCPYHETARIERFMEPARAQPARKFFKRRFFRHTIEKICDLGNRGRRSRTQQPGHSSMYSNMEEKSPAPASAKRPYPDEDPIPTFISAPIPAPGPDPTSAPISLGYYNPMAEDQLPVELDSMSANHFFHEEPYFPSLVQGPTAPAAFHESEEPELSNIISELPGSMGAMLAEMDASSIQAPMELSDKRMSSSSTQSTSCGSFTPESGLSPISPLTPRSIYGTEGFDLPISPADIESFGATSIRHIVEMRKPIASGGENFDYIPRPAISPISETPGASNRKAARQIPHIRVDTSCNTPPASENASPFSSIPSDSPASDASDLAPPAAAHTTEAHSEGYNSKELVQELRGLFNCLFKLSMRKLCQPTLTDAGSHLLSMRPSAAQLFTSGIAALHKVVRNEVPQDFFEIFGLSILPYACGIAGMDENMQDQFGAIFQEQLAWSQAIIDPDLHKTYVSLIWELWSTSEYQMAGAYQASQQMAMNEMDGLAQALAVGNSFGLPDFGLEAAESSMMTASAAHLGFHSSPFSIHDTGIKLCLNYLDAFEYLQVNLQEVATYAQDTPGFDFMPSGPAYSSVLMQQVMRPLATNVSLCTFKPVVDMTCVVIDSTQNITLRSTELSLLEEARGQGEVPLLLKDFAGEVHKACDNAAIIMGCPGYRAFYYLNDIDQIIEIHNELLAIERHNRMLRSRSSSLCSPKGKSPLNASPASSGYSESFASTPHRSYAFAVSSSSSSPIEAGFFHSRNNSNENIFNPNHRSAFSFNVSSPTVRAHSSAWERSHASKRINASPITGSSTPQGTESPVGGPTGAAPRPDEKIKRQCPFCSQQFEQKAQYMKANITRHIREKHSDNAKKLVCSEPGCTYTSTRKGNLTHHRRALHGIID